MSDSNLYRQKSLDSISSPDQLNDYISVTSPSVWLLLLSLILVLIGSVIWGTFGRLESRITVPAIVHDGVAELYVEAEKIMDVNLDDEVEIEDAEGLVVSLGNEGQSAGDVLGDLSITESGLAKDDIVYIVEAEISVPNGIYLAEIVTDSVSPLSFLTNEMD